MKQLTRQMSLLALVVLALALLALSACGDAGISQSEDGDADSDGDAPDGDTTPTACVYDADCPDDKICHEGLCLSEMENPCGQDGSCRDDSDCGAQQICDDLCLCREPGATDGDADGDKPDGDADGDAPDGDEPGDCPQLSAEARLDFGYVPYDTDAVKTLHLQNDCDGTPLTITSIEFVDDTDEFRFVTPPTFPIVLQDSNDVHELQIAYHPLDIGVDENTLLISSNDPTGGVRVNLVSQYKGINDIEADPNPLSFQNVVVGEAAATRTLIVRNKRGEAQDNAVLRVNAVYLESETTTTFSLEAVETPFYLGQGQERELTLRCHPQAQGEFSDRLILESNDPDEASYAVELSCNGVLPVLSVETLADGNLLDFGAQRVGVGTQVVLTVSNSGGGDLVVQPPVLTEASSPYFTLDVSAFSEGAKTLTAGQSVSLPVNYEPDAQGAHSGQIRFSSNGFGTETLNVNLAGQALPGALSASPNPLTFADLRVGAQDTQAVTFTNEGDLPITLTQIAFDPAQDALSFGDNDVLDNITLQPEQSHSISVVFSPEARGTFNSSVHVTTDDTVANELNVPVNARGIAPNLVLSEDGQQGLDDPVDGNNAGRIDFGETSLNGSGERVLVITNGGDASLSITGISLAANSPDFEFSFTDPGVITLQPEQTARVTLSYDPIGLPGPDSGRLRLVSDQPGLGPQIIELAGMATNQKLGYSVAQPMNFDALHFGATATRTLSLTNTGLRGTLLVEYVELVDNGGAFALLLPEVSWPVSLAPEEAESLSLQIRFNPPAGDSGGPAIEYDGLLRIYTNSYLSTESDYALEGIGQPCSPGCWDLDDNPNDCEYCGCDISNGGVEICDGVDNDCNKLIDDGEQVTQNCSPPSHATAVCTPLGSCDFACNESFHRCGDACVYDWDPAHCGENCTPCEGTPENAAALCIADGGAPVCDWECNDGYVWHHDACREEGSAECCGPSCVDCGANPQNGYWACESEACVLYCVSDYHPCGNVCRYNFDTDSCGGRCDACPEPPTNGAATCDGLSCGISCTAGFYESGTECAPCNVATHCGASCAPCPQPAANGSATCDGVFCGIDCNSGYYQDGTACLACDTAAHCGETCNPCGALANGYYECNGGACEPVCNSGYVMDEGQCVSGNTADCCGASCATCPGGQNSHGVCRLIGENDWQCDTACDEDYYDLNGDGVDCEYFCEYQGENDEPDDGFVDYNCDGIDGMVSKSIFVATPADGGSDSNAGTRTSPLATIQAGITAANGSTVKKYVLVSSGVYTGPVTLANGVRVHGGYSKANGWERGLGFVATIQTLTSGSTRLVGVYAHDLTSPTVLDRISVVVGDNPNTGGSNYGLHLVNAGALEVRGVTVVLGVGGAGNSGGDGANAVLGGVKGGNGEDGCDDGHTWACDLGGYNCDRPIPGAGGVQASCLYGGQPGRGGNGGASGKDNGGDGRNGSPGETAPSGGTGGAGGTCCSPPGEHGQNGNPGVNGAAGSDASAGAAFGAVAGEYYTPANGGAATDGAGGRGGGGGGGGGGGVSTVVDCESYGGAGGGGGSGGCAGQAATSGAGGGGVFGVWFVNSPAMLVNVTVSASAGGAGGSGGTGGTGTVGGDAGSGGPGEESDVNDPSGNGGSGGAGGRGGRGGHGGGGGGGPSYCFYNASGDSPQLSSFSCSGTEGGAGGASPGNDGQTGVYGQKNW